MQAHTGIARTTSKIAHDLGLDVGSVGTAMSRMVSEPSYGIHRISRGTYVYRTPREDNTDLEQGPPAFRLPLKREPAVAEANGSNGTSTTDDYHDRARKAAATGQHKVACILVDGQPVVGEFVGWVVR